MWDNVLNPIIIILTSTKVFLCVQDLYRIGRLRIQNPNYIESWRRDLRAQEEKRGTSRLQRLKRKMQNRERRLQKKGRTTTKVIHGGHRQDSKRNQQREGITKSRRKKQRMPSTHWLGAARKIWSQERQIEAVGTTTTGSERKRWSESYLLYLSIINIPRKWT